MHTVSLPGMNKLQTASLDGGQSPSGISCRKHLLRSPLLQSLLDFPLLANVLLVVELIHLLWV